MSRIYIVTPRVAEAGKPVPKRLVRARNSAQVLRHVATDFNVTVPSQDELIAARDEGVKVEEATTKDAA
jgi:hypothetical protein